MADLAHPGERFTRPERTRLAEPAHALDFRVREDREHLGASRVDDRWFWLGHDGLQRDGISGVSSLRPYRNDFTRAHAHRHARNAAMHPRRPPDRV
jgi:hypothetical protein